MASQKGYDETRYDYSPQPYYQPPQGPPKDNTRTIIIIIVVVFILFVVLPMMAAMLLYWHALDMIDNPPYEQKPVVSFSQAYIGATTATVDIAMVDPAGKELAEFKAILVYNGSLVDGTISPLTDGGSAGSLTFTDMDGGGTLSAGDRFTINIMANTDYELTIYYGTEKLVTRTFTVI
jgi:hypothetical protein